MWNYTLHKFKCPYCGHEYESTVGHGTNYEYKGKIYSAVEPNCFNCGREFLYGNVKDGDDKFIKMPEDRSELKVHSVWMS